MNIALCGVPSVGKHKLAQTYAREAGIEYANIPMEAVLQKTASMPFMDMLAHQDRLLSASVAEYERIRARGNQFIAACNPINMSAYALLASTWSDMTARERRSLMVFMEKCKSATQNYFTMLVMLQPQEPDVFSGFDITRGDIQNEILNSILLGAVHQDYYSQTVVSMSRKIVTLPERMTVMRQAVHNVSLNAPSVPLVASFEDGHGIGTLH